MGIDVANGGIIFETLSIESKGKIGINNKISPITHLDVNGSVRSVENTLVSATAPDFTEGNMWVIANGVQVFSPAGAAQAPAGMSGVFRVTGAPAVWGTSDKFPGGTAPTINSFPAIIPFYIQDSNNILCGAPVEDCLMDITLLVPVVSVVSTPVWLVTV